VNEVALCHTQLQVIAPRLSEYLMWLKSGRKKHEQHAAGSLTVHRGFGHSSERDCTINLILAARKERTKTTWVYYPLLKYCITVQQLDD